MRFDTKIAIAVRDDLATWQRLNVTAFLASGVAAGFPETMGKPYEDAIGNRYLSMFRQPVLIYAGDTDALAAVHRRALTRELLVGVYTEELFRTDNDDDNRDAVRNAVDGELDLVGIAAYGPRNGIDKVFKGLTLHP